MHRLFFTWSLWVCLCLTALIAKPVTADDGFVVFRDGKPQAAVIVPKDAPDDVKIAASVFTGHVKEGYGVDLPVMAGDETPAGNVPNRIELVVEKRLLADENHTLVDFPSQDVMRITGGEMGVIRTLFVILEDFAGVRFLYQGAHGFGGHGSAAESRRRFHYPQLNELVIPRKSFEHDAAFPHGRILQLTNKYFNQNPDGTGGMRWYYWTWLAQLGSVHRVNYAHAAGSMPNPEARRGSRGILFPIHAYADGSITPDPEIFPIIKGERFLPHLAKDKSRWHRGWHPCYSGQASEDEAVRNILASMENDPTQISFSLAGNDLGGFCECEKCRAIDSFEPNSVGLPNRSESYYRWVNRVATRVLEKYPDLQFGVMAYREVMDPPSFKVHPHVTVVITLDYQATIAPDMRKDRYDLITRWSEKAAGLGTWSYDIGSHGFTFPRVYFKQHQEMLQHLHNHHGKLVFSEGGGHYYTLVEGPRMYLLLKMMENPDLDREAVIMDWCNAAVSKEAAPYLREYFAFWEDYWQTKAIKVDQFWDRRGQTYLQRGYFAADMYGLERGDMAKLRPIMENMLDQAKSHGDQWQKERAELLMSSFEWAEAAATAGAAELISPDGMIHDTQTAVDVVNNIPASEKAFDRWVQIIADTKDWVANKQILTTRLRYGVTGYSLLPAAYHLQEKPVREALQSLSTNTDATADMRALASAMLSLQDDGVTAKPRTHDTFEDDKKLAWKTGSPVHGSVARSQEQTAEGQSSLMCTINHPNFQAVRALPKINPAADHFVALRLYLQPREDADLSSGIIEVTGRPNHTGWNTPRLKLQPGQWHWVYAYIPRSSQLNEAAISQIVGELGGVEETVDVSKLIAGQINVRMSDFPNGTTAYIDDVRVFELPVAR